MRKFFYYALLLFFGMSSVSAFAVEVGVLRCRVNVVQDLIVPEQTKVTEVLSLNNGLAINIGLTPMGRPITVVRDADGYSLTYCIRGTSNAATMLLTLSHRDNFTEAQQENSINIEFNPERLDIHQGNIFEFDLNTINNGYILHGTERHQYVIKSFQVVCRPVFN